MNTIHRDRIHGEHNSTGRSDSFRRLQPTTYRVPPKPRAKGDNLQPKNGFTLVELLVASGIFVIVVIILTSFSGQFIFTQRRDIAEQDLLEDLRLSLETFNREARTAYGDTYLSARPDGTSVIFRNQNGACVNYRVEQQRLERAELSPAVACEPAAFSNSGAIYTPLTSSGVVVTNALFDVEPSTVGGGRTGDSSDAGELTGRVALCHIPPGDPDNKHTITVGAAVVQSHLDHGDNLGPCEGEEGEGAVLTSQGFITVVLQAEATNQILTPINLQSTVVSRQVTPFPTNQ